MEFESKMGTVLDWKFFSGYESLPHSGMKVSVRILTHGRLNASYPEVKPDVASYGVVQSARQCLKTLYCAAGGRNHIKIKMWCCLRVGTPHRVGTFKLFLRVSVEKHKITDNEVKYMLDNNIPASSSSWASPCLLLDKTDSSPLC